ncbi:MAG: ADP-ribosylglycohydrolase family protein [Spirochaetaceae bacterium]|nr:MAG: ADP-ribosylglycohydrolase family protein [Spirochaetaceae bacterium]
MRIFVRMNTIPTTEPVRAALLGTLIADAAGMGLHWIYSQGKIAQIVRANGGEAAFIAPDPKNYEGVPAFFAHPLKNAGDSTQYGEYLYLALRATTSDGFDAGAFLREFQAHFGPGGTYVGYADTPMRETLFNVAHLGKVLHERAMAVDSSLEQAKQKDAAHYIARYFFEFDVDGLKTQVRTPLKLKEWSASELAEADRIVDVLSEDIGAVGPDDDQLPALTRSALLAHFYAGTELDAVTERAVRVTNNNDTAVAYAVFMARVLRDLYEKQADLSGGEGNTSGDGGGESGDGAALRVSRQTLRSAIESHMSVLDEESADLIREALAYTKLDYRGATKRFGAACHLNMGVPIVLHILMHTGSFAEAVNANTMASGDNCGRAVLLGAISGVLYGIGGETGIPEDWIERTTILKRVGGTSGGSVVL